MKFATAIPFEFHEYSFENDDNSDGVADYWQDIGVGGTYTINTPGFRSRKNQQLATAGVQGLIKLITTNTLVDKTFTAFVYGKVNSATPSIRLSFDWNNGNDQVLTVMPIDEDNFLVTSVVATHTHTFTALSSIAIRVSQVGAGGGATTNVDHAVISYDEFTIASGTLLEGLPKEISPSQTFRNAQHHLSGFDASQGATKYRIPLAFNNISSSDFTNFKNLWEDTRATFNAEPLPIAFQRESDLADFLPPLLVCYWVDQGFDWEELTYVGSGFYNVRMTLEEI